MKRTTLAVVGVLLTASVPAYAVAVTPGAATTASAASVAAPVPARPRADQAQSVAAAAAAATVSPAAAVSLAASHAAADGATAYISVVNRATGTVAAQTGNAGSQVGSESIMKLIIASYYLVLYGGYTNTPSSVLSQLSYMLRYSDDATASSLFTANAIPTIAARYGMGSTINATDRPGHWGAARITAHDMARFLYRAASDPQVGPWLVPVMSQTAPNGSDGFNQHYGLNALSGVHGSKQGWGCDSYFTAKQCAIHSVGYTDRYFVAVLQLSDSYPDPMRSTATFAAQQVQASRPAPPPPPPAKPVGNGDFVWDPTSGGIYRIAGGAPVYVSRFAAVAGSTSFRRLTAAQFNALPKTPAAGTLLQAGHEIYVTAGGAPIYVSSYANIGGPRSAVKVDPAAIVNAGHGGRWNHLNQYPAAKTLLQAGHEIYVTAGGAPIYVSNYSAIGGSRPATKVDPVAVVNAGRAGRWNHLNAYSAAGTFVLAAGSIYRMAGGAPIYVPSFAPFGGPQRWVRIDVAAITNAGHGGRWNHVRYYPADGTLLQGLPGTKVYRVIGGRPSRVSSVAFKVTINQLSIDRAGQPGVWSHLKHP